MLHSYPLTLRGYLDQIHLFELGLVSNTKGMAGTQKIQVVIKKLEESFNPFLSIRKEPNDKDEGAGLAG
jgi:hypothetical protein